MSGSIKIYITGVKFLASNWVNIASIPIPFFIDDPKQLFKDGGKLAGPLA